MPAVKKQRQCAARNELQRIGVKHDFQCRIEVLPIGQPVEGNQADRPQREQHRQVFFPEKQQSGEDQVKPEFKHQ